MGLKWQCVEYARRYLYKTKGMVFDSVDAAIDIWDLPSVTLLSTKEKYSLIQYSNGDALTPPKEGDLMIWPRQGTDSPFGHVAIVAGIEQNNQGFLVQVAEQNFLNEKWMAPDNYARTIPGKVSAGRYTVTDLGFPIAGWMSVGYPVQSESPIPPPRGWDTTMLGLLAIPIIITALGIAVLAYKRHREDKPRPRHDGHLLLDEDQVMPEAIQPNGSSGDGDLELEQIR